MDERHRGLVFFKGRWWKHIDGKWFFFTENRKWYPVGAR
jgi:hypothetical protein